MARTVRRKKDPKTGKSVVVEVLEDTKGKRKRSESEKETLRAQRKANIVKPGEVSKKKKEDVVLPTIDIGGPKKPSLLEAAKKQLTKTKLIAGAPDVDVSIGTKLTVGAMVFGSAGFLGARLAAAGTRGATTFGKVGAKTIGKVQSNVKTIAQTKSLLEKFFSAKSLAILGGAAGAMFLGQWGQAEAGEPISIAMRDALKQAENTGDWAVYDEAKAARDELTNLDLWKKIALWTPIAPLIGIQNKIKGVIAGGIVLDRIAENNKIAQEAGESEDDKWARIREQEKEDDKANVDYYNEQRKLMVEWEREATKDARNADAAFWRKEKEKQMKLEEEDRKAIADFWIAYRKETLKIANDNRPSNLNFGLL